EDDAGSVHDIDADAVAGHPRDLVLGHGGELLGSARGGWCGWNISTPAGLENFLLRPLVHALRRVVSLSPALAAASPHRPPPGPRSGWGHRWSRSTRAGR